jgi:hypothetical protein
MLRKTSLDEIPQLFNVLKGVTRGSKRNFREVSHSALAAGFLARYSARHLSPSITIVLNFRHLKYLP